MSDNVNGLNFKLYTFNNAIIEPFRHFVLKTDENYKKDFYFRFTYCNFSKYKNILNQIKTEPDNMIKTEFDDVFFIPTSTNYYHMMIETLPRLWGYFKNKNETILINRNFIDTFNGLYDMLNDYMNFDKIIFSNYNRPSKGATLIDGRITNQRYFINKLKLYGSTNINHLSSFDEVKNLAVAFWQRYTQEKFTSIKPFRKIFINRTIKENTLQKKLRCANQEEIYKQLKKKDFELLDPNEVDVLTAAKMCYEAKEIVGVHGAGLTNIIFAQPGTKFTQLTYNNKQEDIYKKIANILKLDYKVSYGLKKDKDEYAKDKELFYIRGEL